MINLILFCFLVLLCFSNRAFGATNEAANALPPAAADDKTLEAVVYLRDPFWPIGFFPPSMPGKAPDSAKAVRPKEGNETAVHTSSLSDMLRIGGVVRMGDKFYATVNGFTVQVGEVVTVVADGEVYQFVVKKIDFNKVQFKPVRR